MTTNTATVTRVELARSRSRHFFKQYEAHAESGHIESFEVTWTTDTPPPVGSTVTVTITHEEHQ